MRTMHLKPKRLTASSTIAELAKSRLLDLNSIEFKIYVRLVVLAGAAKAKTIEPKNSELHTDPHAIARALLRLEEAGLVKRHYSKDARPRRSITVR